MTFGEFAIRIDAMLQANPNLKDAEVIMDNKEPVASITTGKDEEDTYIYLSRCK